MKPRQKILTITSLAVMAAGLGGYVLTTMPAFADKKNQMETPGPDMTDQSTAYDFSFTDIDGTDLPLSRYKGKVVMVVNTASKCGFTGQYAGLEKLYQEYRDRGLVIVGIPSNDFGQQEPGSAEQIKKFCTDNFKITFPLTEKTVVTGDQAHPFYKWAAEKGVGSLLAEKPRWNFHKYVIDRDGHLVGSFASATTPDSDKIKTLLDALLPTSG